MKKSLKAVVAVFAIIAVVYSLLVFLIPFEKCVSDYVAYGFTMASFIVAVYSGVKAFKGETLISKFYGFPIFKVGYIYAIVQFIISVIFYVLGAFVAVPYWVAIIVCLIPFALAIIGILLTSMAKENIEQIDVETKEKTAQMSTIKLSVDGIIDICEDKDVLSKLESLKETVKYSDPVSCEMTVEIESTICQELDELRVMVEKQDNDGAKDMIKQIINAVNSRNRICKENKGK